MANERENNTNYTIYENGPLGEVQISPMKWWRSLQE